MRYLLLLLFSFLQLSSFAQSKIDSDISGHIEDMKLPYRDLVLNISHRIDSSSAYYDIHRAIDAYLISENLIREYSCHIRFDSYTDDVFVYFRTVYPDNYFNFTYDYIEEFSPIFIKSSIETDPTFIDNWTSYLDSCFKIEEYSGEVLALRKSSILFKVDKKGNFETNTIIENSKLLKSFFNNNNKFRVAVLNGEPLNVKVELPFASSIEENYDKSILSVHYEVPFMEGVYFSKEIRDFGDNTTVISLVWNDKKWVSSVCHSGSLDQCSKLSDRFRDLDRVVPFPYVDSVFERVYFYTLN